MRKTDWKAVAYIAVLLSLAAALAWGIANCGCPQ
jgi:hypothetical protein